MTDLHFLKTAILDYKVGAITTTTKFAIQRILKALRPDASFVIEYGPGDGVITRHLLNHIPPAGRVVGIETNTTFVDDLKKIVDERLTVLHDDVIKVSRNFSVLGLPQIDAMISGIPFSFLKPQDREALIAQTAAALAPGKQFIVYQYSLLVLPILKKHFSRVDVQFEPLNFPPYFVMAAVK